ncbi:MAG: hypothetical protein U0401_20075 [Anaerolineae bacterium]
MKKLSPPPERWADREDFFRQLNELWPPTPLLWVVLTLREDYVAALDPYAHLLTGKLQARCFMQRMGSQSRPGSSHQAGGPIW